jgi:succinate-acetate transporter protein
VLSHQDGCHSAVALFLKAALIQVSDYRPLGASGFAIVLFLLSLWKTSNKAK